MVILQTGRQGTKRLVKNWSKGHIAQTLSERQLFLKQGRITLRKRKGKGCEALSRKKFTNIPANDWFDPRTPAYDGTLGQTCAHFHIFFAPSATHQKHHHRQPSLGSFHKHSKTFERKSCTESCSFAARAQQERKSHLVASQQPVIFILARRNPSQIQIQLFGSFCLSILLFPLSFTHGVPLFQKKSWTHQQVCRILSVKIFKNP